jgi:flagellar protein FlbD
LHQEESVIQVTRLNGTMFYLNAELIQTVESTPDTVITLVDYSKFVVRETPDEIIQRCLEYRRSIHRSI